MHDHIPGGRHYFYYIYISKTLPLFQQETLSLLSKAVHHTHILKKIVQDKDSASTYSACTTA